MSLLSKLPADISAEQPEWLRELRRDALGRLREAGLPNRKVESWRFTPAGGIADQPREIVTSSFAVTGDAQDGVRVCALRDALDGELAALVEQELGQHVTGEHFAALNATLFSDGVVVVIDRGAALAEPISITHETPATLAGNTPSVAYPRVLVIAGEGCEATLVESYPGGGSDVLVSGVTEIALRSRSRLRHVRTLAGAAGDRNVGALGVHQGPDSVYEGFVATLGGGLSRLDASVALAGSGAECSLTGVYHADTGELVDHHVRVEHVEPHTSSNVRYRGIVDGSGHAVFDAIGVVHRDAQKTSAHQENRNLLLSDSAAVNTKPHLEIDADDVVASHGATVGDLDDDQLFYLRARGIDEVDARAILTCAFVHALVDGIPVPVVRDSVIQGLLARVPNGPSIGEFVS